MRKLFLLPILLSFLYVSSTSAQLKVSLSGNVSVGRAVNSASSLSVNALGNSLYSAYVNGNCKVDSGYINGRLYTPEYYEISSKSLQWAMKILSETPVYGYGITSGLHIPNQPDPVAYSHISLDGHLLANDFPGLVKTDEDGHYVINYSEFVPLLIYGFQQLYALIQHLHPNENIQQLLANENLTNESENEEEQSQPMMAKQRFSNAVLYQNSPNPFTALTTIRFNLPEGAEEAFIFIFDMTGKTLKQIPVTPSMQSITVQGYELSSGMYLYSLVINGQEIDTKRMILSN